ncbi:MAG: MraY family glycosyltransferase [Nitrospirota bacterium]
MKSTITTIIQTLLLPFAISYTLTPVVIKLGKRFNIVDTPNERKIHEFPTPVGSGIGIYIAFLVFFILFPPEKVMSGLLAGSSIIFLVGLIDDIKGVSVFKRLMAHILASMLLIAFGVSVIIFKNEGIGFLLNSLITILWVVGITNAMNFFDGMDGLASGLSIIYSFFLGIVFLQNQNISMYIVSLALIGSTLSFLPYNFRVKGSAEIFLGDSGSNLLGFVLASFAVMGNGQRENSLILLQPHS